MLLKFCNWIPYKKSYSFLLFIFCFCSFFLFISSVFRPFLSCPHSHFRISGYKSFRFLQGDWLNMWSPFLFILQCFFSLPPFFCLELCFFLQIIFFSFSLPSFFCLDFHLPDHLPLSVSYPRWGNDGTYANSSFSSGFNICMYIHICKCGCSLGYFVLKSTQQSLHVLVSLSVHRLSF